jgi:DNA polymerase I-like protein with 3'-5' exonuclease and polymerase domains
MPKTHGIRECFEPDGLFVFADYAAIEMAGLAQVHLNLFGESSLARAINDGFDLHCVLGAQLVNMTYEQFRTKYKAGDPELADMRQAAKAANFGFPGMMGEATFVASKKKVGTSVCEWFYRDGKCREQVRLRAYKDRPLDVPLCKRCIMQAKQLREGYLKMWPEMKPYWDKVTMALRKWDDHIPQLVSGRVRGGLTGPAAANTLFQGLVADGAKQAIRLITGELYTGASALHGARLVYFAHDEIGLDVPGGVEQARLAAKRLVELMKRGMGRFIPDVRVDAEPVIMNCWSKQAKPVFNDQKELDIWTQDKSK